jgi:hypothetical protein
MVVGQRSAEPFAAHDGAVLVGGSAVRDGDGVAKPLVVALGVEVLDVLGDGAAQVTFAQRDDSIQALLPDRAYPFGLPRS